ncbi:phosphotransferase [Virgibacillus halophilus]|uniref:Phosphotransferase n=1 Tax=Tigheibacillus halophilus TaxID=361280 RepID=A0ABU5CEQ9_9BACI|nr:phosphotransferase [Virgibacillus halophilus]
MNTSLQYLQQLLPVTASRKQVVCHGDIDHHNFLRAANGKLYLIDWDNALIGDPTMDYANILHWYIPKEKWGVWLAQYGIEKDEYLLQRMYWYLVLDAMSYIAWHFERRQWGELEKRLNHIQSLNKEIKKWLMS